MPQLELEAITPLAFHETSVVPEGDNPQAVIVLAKEKRMPAEKKTGAKADPADPLAAFSDEQKAAVKALMDDACKRSVDDYKAAEAQKAAAAAAEEDMPEEKPEEGKAAGKAKQAAEASAKAQAELSAKVAAQEKELAEYKAKLSEERDARLTREYAAEAGKFRTLPSTELASVLRAVDEQCPKETGKALRTVLAAADERAKLGVDVLAARHGRSDDMAPAGDPDAVLEAAAKALQAKDPKLDGADAYRLAMQQNPQAYLASKLRSQGRSQPV